MDTCSLHTILRLPDGMFYAQAVRTNILFFARGETDEDETDEVWIYDMRTNSRTHGKLNPLKLGDFEEFFDAWGDDVDAPWQGEFSDREETWDEEADEPLDDTEGRWRRYTRDEVAERGDNLDITWLHDERSERANGVQRDPRQRMLNSLLERRIREISGDFRDLLDKEPGEHAVQRFLEEHRVLWGSFSPNQIISKPRLINQYEAGFGLLTAQSVLYLVEIERPSIQLTRDSDGRRSAELAEPFGQIHDWKTLMQKDRSGVLRYMDVEEDEVQHVKYCLVAGRNEAASDEGVHRIRRAMDGNMEFLTYDDLIQNMVQFFKIFLGSRGLIAGDDTGV